MNRLIRYPKFNTHALTDESLAVLRAMIFVTFMCVCPTLARSQDSVEVTLHDLIRATESVRTQINGVVDESAGNHAPAELKLDSHNDAAPGSADASARAREIRDRLRLLRRLRQSPPTKNDQPQTPMIPSPLPSVSPVSPKSSNPASPTTLNAIEKSLEPMTSVDESGGISPQSITATQVVPQAVDHLRLGESLYQTQNYAAAQKALQAVDRESLTASESIWHELLLALCRRRLNDESGSEAALRELVSADSDGKIGTIASWWLGQITLNNVDS